jgi:hypothetical protein
MIWVAYYTDWSGFAVFADDDELGALRHAVERHMEVARIPFGVDVREAVREA